MNISKTWDIDPRDFVQVVKTDISKAVMTLAEKVFYGVISRTPVYTGSLRASWVVSNIERYGVVVGGSPVSVLPPPTFPDSIKATKPDVIYIMNSTPYAGLVEFGGPTNPPRAMVQNTINSL